MAGSIFDSLKIDKVVLSLFSEIQHNKKKHTIEDIAVGVGITPAHAASIIRELMKHGLLLPESNNTYKINYNNDIAILISLLAECDRASEFLFINRTVKDAYEKIKDYFDFVAYIADKNEFLASPENIELTEIDNIRIISCSQKSLKKFHAEHYYILKGISYLLL